MSRVIYASKPAGGNKKRHPGKSRGCRDWLAVLQESAAITFTNSGDLRRCVSWYVDVAPGRSCVFQANIPSAIVRYGIDIPQVIVFVYM